MRFYIFLYLQIQTLFQGNASFRRHNFDYWHIMRRVDEPVYASHTRRDLPNHSQNICVIPGFITLLDATWIHVFRFRTRVGRN